MTQTPEKRFFSLGSAIGGTIAAGVVIFAPFLKWFVLGYFTIIMCAMFYNMKDELGKFIE